MLLSVSVAVLPAEPEDGPDSEKLLSPFRIRTVARTGGAGSHMALPPCLASMVHGPTDVSLRAAPAIAQIWGLSTTAYDTGSFEVAEACSESERPVAYFVAPPAGAGNVIRCCRGPDGGVGTTRGVVAVV